MTLSDQIEALGASAREAAHRLAQAPSEQKNEGLREMADALEEASEEILQANAKDIASGEARDLSPAMLDRLRLDSGRLVKMANGIRQVALLPDPVGDVLRDWTREDGLRITKVRVPIGVIGIIYESRPNVTSDAAVLCLKTANATILRGGSEAISSNMAITRALQRGLSNAKLPEASIQLIPFTDREGVRLLAEADRFVDLLIPRGGRGLIETVVANARMPVIKHYDGVCVGFVHRDADSEMACDLVVNAKAQRPGVCNALETLLVDRQKAPILLPPIAEALIAANVELRCDEEAIRLLHPRRVTPATAADFQTEFLDLILAIKVVADLDEAVAHTNQYGSHHSDLIITRSEAAAEQFLREVDSATVYWNASTRFTDGGEFGFGAEIGISTDKLHARGPMGLEELTTYKYLMRGNGHIRH